MVRVFTVSSANTLNSDPYTSPHDIGTKEFATREIEKEKVKHTLISEERTRVFEDILDNTPSRHVSLKYIFKVFYGLIVLLISITVYTLVPVHNVVLHPQYWYELPIQVTFSFIPTFAAYHVYRCYYGFNISKVKTLGTFILMLVTGTLSTLISFGISNLVWTYVLHFQLPLPLLGYFLYLNMTTAILATIWYRFPKQWRHDPKIRNRTKFYVIGNNFEMFINMEAIVVTKILLSIPSIFQWIAALFLPLLREFNLWIILKISNKSCDGDYRATRLLFTQVVLTAHSLLMAYTIGSIATLESSIVIIGADILFNGYLCFKIMYLKRKDQTLQRRELQMILMQELVVAGIIEFIVPLSYLLCFLMAYFGPNATLIGNVKNSYWQFRATEDINHTIIYLCIFFFIDLLSLLLCAQILWKFCKLSLYRAFAALQKEFGYAFAFCMTNYLNGVSIEQI